MESKMINYQLHGNFECFVPTKVEIGAFFCWCKSTHYKENAFFLLSKCSFLPFFALYIWGWYKRGVVTCITKPVVFLIPRFSPFPLCKPSPQQICRKVTISDWYTQLLVAFFLKNAHNSRLCYCFDGIVSKKRPFLWYQTPEILDEYWCLIPCETSIQDRKHPCKAYPNMVGGKSCHYY